MIAVATVHATVQSIVYPCHHKRLFRTPRSETHRGDSFTKDGVSGETGDAGRMVNARLDFGDFANFFSVLGSSTMPKKSSPPSESSESNALAVPSAGAASTFVSTTCVPFVASRMSKVNSMVSGVTALVTVIGSAVVVGKFCKTTRSKIPATSFLTSATRLRA